MGGIKVLQKGFPGKADIALLYLSSVLYLELDDRKILCDVGPISARKNLIKVMREENIDPADIDCILITHLHHDHAANIDLFPNAAVILSQVEWDYARESGDQAVQKAYLTEYQDRKLLLVTEDGQEVLPGITAYFVPGHTPGSLCYACEIDGEAWILAGDAVKNREELRSGEVTLTVDPEKSRSSIRRIREMADVVAPGHDCLLRVSGEEIIPLEKNELTLMFPEGMTVNGCNPLVLRVD